MFSLSLVEGLGFVSTVSALNLSDRYSLCGRVRICVNNICVDHNYVRSSGVREQARQHVGYIGGEYKHMHTHIHFYLVATGLPMRQAAGREDLFPRSRAGLLHARVAGLPLRQVAEGEQLLPQARSVRLLPHSRALWQLCACQGPFVRQGSFAR